MNNYKEFFTKLISEYPFSFSSVISRKFKDVLQYLINKYPQLNNHPIAEYIYWELNDLNEFPVCHNNNCQNKVKFINIKAGYRKCCSIACTNKSAEHINKIKQITDNDPLFWIRRTEKSRQTKFERYGDENYCNIEQCKLTRYTKNDGHYHAEDFIEKAKATKKIRYGNENYCNIERAHETIQNKLKNNPLYYKEIADKSKNTRFLKYGDCNYVNSEKAIQTNCANHNGIMHMQTDEFKRLVAKNRRRITYDKLLLDPKKQLLMSFEEFENASINNLNLRYKCRSCGYEFEIQHHIGNRFLYLYMECPNCFPKLHDSAVSYEEKELVEFLKLNNIQIYENMRHIIKPYELDIYIPDKKIAIEFDGLYWHSEINKPNKNYHLLKTEKCEQNGIMLIHVFENEWKFKRKIVESRIKNLLGLHENTVFARQCNIQELDLQTANCFQNENHIQGAVNASVRLGLFYNNELVSLMTFGKCRFDKKHEWEMLRFCNKLGYHIPGAASKLLKYFEKTHNPKSIVSYADRRWSQGNLYKALGFNLDHISPPDYWYWNATEFSSRVKYQKHKLHSILKTFDPLKTEIENMYANGYNRIFDCGNMVFIKDYV